MLDDSEQLRLYKPVDWEVASLWIEYPVVLELVVAYAGLLYHAIYSDVVHCIAWLKQVVNADGQSQFVLLSFNREI